MKEEGIILFDGVCNYCNRMVNFVLRNDKSCRYKFAPLQSTHAQEALAQHNLSTTDFDSFFLITKHGVFKKSTAALKVMEGLPWYWQWARLFWIIPKPLRDAVYGFVARHRYKLFGRKEACMVPDAAVKDRFLN